MANTEKSWSSMNIELTGNLGKDPNKFSQEGRVSAVGFSVASKSKDIYGERVTEASDWYEVTMYGDDADRAVAVLNKGDQVRVTGRLFIGEYTDKSGVTHPTRKIQANSVTPTMRTLAQKLGLEEKGSANGGTQVRSRTTGNSSAQSAPVEEDDFDGNDLEDSAPAPQSRSARRSRPKAETDPDVDDYLDDDLA